MSKSDGLIVLIARVLTVNFPLWAKCLLLRFQFGPNRLTRKQGDRVPRGSGYYNRDDSGDGRV